MWSTIMDVMRYDEKDPSGHLLEAKSVPFYFGWSHDPPCPPLEEKNQS